MIPPAATSSSLHLLFRLQHDLYAIEAAQIQVVLRRTALKQCPAAPHWVAGLLHYQGSTVPVLDLYQRLLQREAGWQTSTRLVLVHYKQQLLGLLLEQVHRFERLTDQLWQDSRLLLPDHQYLGQVQQHDGLGLIQQVRLADLLPVDVQQVLFPPAQR
ncbi:chemotaxis protein CheW [Rheinheimera sp.]|uniref:chemotaxis protein CheW n=1 Tax=Rheinheimera sp. TaxID=1869214 RepID=UPI00307DD120